MATIIKPQFDIKVFLEKRPLSWSAISSFMYDPEQWYKRYILNEPVEENIEMKFGKQFAKAIEDGKPMAPVTILKAVEHKFQVVFHDIHMIGFADSFCTDTNRKLLEYKTAKQVWTQDKVDNHGQLTLYSLFNFITNKVKPEEMEIALECIQTIVHGDFTIELKKPIKVHHFKTQRSMMDILKFGQLILATVDQMEQYVNNKK